LRTRLAARRLKRTSEEPGGQIATGILRIGKTRHFRPVNKGERRRPSRRERREQSVIHARLPRAHAALHHVPRSAMMAGHSIPLGTRRRIPRRRRMMPAMRQAAHPVAIRHARIHTAGQRSQRRCQQRDDHQNRLNPPHREKLYHSRLRPVNCNC